MTNIMIYYGDFDTVCNFIGGQQFVDNLGYKLKEPYHVWTVNGRIAGFVKRYEGILFILVRAAGHFVPADQPLAALDIVRQLIGKT